MSTNGSTVTPPPRGLDLVVTSPWARKPGRIHGVRRAMARQATPTRRALRPPTHLLAPDWSCHSWTLVLHAVTAPHWPTRHGASANRTASADARKAMTSSGRPASERMRFAKPSRAAGGKSAWKGLLARTARAWHEKAAAHDAVTAASTREGRGKAGATSVAAAWPT